MAEPISKIDAVRDALKRGFDRPQQAVEWIKEHHGVEMSTAMFSSYKSNESKKGDGGVDEKKANGGEAKPTSTVIATKRTQGEPTPPAPSPAKPSPQPARKPSVVSTNGGGGSFDLELAKQIKELVASHGIEKVRELVNLFE